MTQTPIIFVLAVSLLLQAPASPQSDSGKDLALGIRQVDEGDLDGAVITLDGVIRQLAGQKHREKELATAHLYISMAHLGLSQWERAKAEMREAWKSNKDMKLDPKKFPPRVLQLYEETRREAKAGTTPPASPAPGASPSPGSGAGGSEPKKGGASKALWVGLGVAAVGGGVALAATGKTEGMAGTCPTGDWPNPTIVSPSPGSTVTGLVTVSCSVPSKYSSCADIGMWFIYSPDSFAGATPRSSSIANVLGIPTYTVAWDTRTASPGLRYLQCIALSAPNAAHSEWSVNVR